ncbi:GTPase IMAP family member 4-like [Archocentrus centrarchus]|uniref:GTPase IMAP family member 4-like n=1 Tax=Archocentrus centrarchus TaxID=63155 RepID=UPI0011EA2727|nr:GTPase IMAP family member 4-like [Archocentrus centrarchus]
MDGDNTSETKVLMDRDTQTVAEAKLPKLKIVLFGRTSAGKSTLGDVIMGNTKAFTSKDTEKCHVDRRTIEDQSVVVVDTPGVSKIGKSEEELVREIKRSADLVSPGPHVFLLVVRAGIITCDELKVLETFESTFGKRALAYTTVVFTYKNQEVDEAEVESGMKKSKFLRELIERCQWRYFTFNFDDTSPTQVTELLKKVTQRTEYCYSHEMLQEAEKAAKQEQQEGKPKPEETTSRRAFLEKSGLVGIIFGSVAGYFLGGGELTSTSTALLGALAGSVLTMGTTALALKAKMLSEKCCQQ